MHKAKFAFTRKSRYNTPSFSEFTLCTDTPAPMARPRYVPGSTFTFEVKNRSGIKPLAAYLASRLGIVDAWAAGLIEDGNVTLDHAPADAHTTINLSAGPHTISVAFPRDWPKHMAATDMPLDILHEDEALLVLNKPAGVVVHPARGHLDNKTLQNGVRFRYRHLIGREDATLGSPHRLDKDTSGVIVFAIDRAAYVDLVAQFTNARPHKEYLAVLDGRADFDAMECDAAIGPNPEKKGCGMFLDESRGGKTASTSFTVLERGDDWTLVRAIPKTGRPHQIRVHAAGLGFPLAGDRDYNDRPDRLGFPRQALHAGVLSFVHPATGRPMTVTAPLPDDMRRALAALGCERATEDSR